MTNLPTSSARPTRPAVVAMLRGLIEAALLAAVAGLIVWLSSTDLGDLAWAAAPGVLVLRAAEGWIDEHIDPTAQRGPLGGTSIE